MNFTKRMAISLAIGLLSLACLSGAPGGTAPVTGTAVSADGARIHYASAGKGEPALVFVHCWECDRTYWDNQVGAFAKGHRVVTLDLAGHGESERGNRSDWTVENYARDVKAVIDRLKLKKVILIGHSMGGPVAAQAAALLPGRVKAVVGIDTFLNVGSLPDPKQIEPFLAALKADFPKTTEGFIRGMMFPPNADPALVDRIAKDMASGPADLGVASMENLWQLDLCPVFQRAKVPIYCINADKFPTNEENGKRCAILFRVRILPGVGHFLQLEKPAEFNRLLEETIVEIMAGK